MPQAIVFTIRPLVTAQVAGHLNRATHAAILRLIQHADPTLAARIHDENGRKPLTVSNVWELGGEQQVTVDPERNYHLRVTLLSPELEHIAARWTPAALEPLDLDGVPWRIIARADRHIDHVWAGSATYQELAMPLLSRPDHLPTVWTFQFASPTTFRQRGINIPIPLPDLVFGSLLDQWNASSELALPDEVRRYAAECLVINRYELRSVASPTSGGVIQIGAVGRCSFRSINHDRYWRACIDVLARFAFYSGIGAGTTRGFGQARLLTKPSDQHHREANNDGNTLSD